MGFLREHKLKHTDLVERSIVQVCEESSEKNPKFPSLDLNAVRTRFYKGPILSPWQ